ncbi:hypothetical protein N7513_010873 [Penicillium frequentans]|nr:hypothetical protein N7513_010873 [Penicillium glabrum]
MSVHRDPPKTADKISPTTQPPKHYPNHRNDIKHLPNADSVPLSPPRDPHKKPHSQRLLPLHERLRQLFRSQEQTPSTTGSPSPAATPISATSTECSSTSPPVPFSLPTSAEEATLRFQEAEQLAKYARAQRTYVELLERYNPGMGMDEEERVRLTARRVGLDVPSLYEAEGDKGKGSE